MFEYKVLDFLPTKKGKYGLKEAFGLSSFIKAEDLENLLNDYAQQGWRVVSVTPALVNLFLGAAGGERLLVTLERKRGE